jgi:hypothetical protein
MMANEKRLIDANATLEQVCVNCCCDFEECKRIGFCADYMNIERLPTVDAVEAKKYEALVEMYHELRENFIDYVCSGIPNVAPYCLNKCEECVDGYGWCKQNSDKCQGFNPAEVILDGEGREGE